MRLTEQQHASVPLRRVRLVSFGVRSFYELKAVLGRQLHLMR
jgi:hypothetical protein